MMQGISAYTIIQAERMMGEEALSVFLRSFSCPKNAEVEDFLKKKALQSSRLSSSMTYLVWSDRHKELLGYFTLAAKAYSVARSVLNSKNRRLVERFAEVDEHGFFTAAVYLIAQIGKNFAIPEERQIHGADLLELALDRFRGTRKAIGGKLVMVEREIDRPRLRDFYNSNGFKSWTTRRNARDGMVYDQMFSVLDNP